MNNLHEENPFEDEKISQEWINSVENEKGLIRDKEIYPSLEKWVRNISQGIIVEIGSGQGICSEKIQNSKLHYIGIEPSVFLTKRAQELYHSNEREFLIGSAYSLPLADNIADGVFSVNVWFHLENLPEASCEMSRILKPGSSFLLITANPNENSLWEKFFINYSKEGKVLDGKVIVPINPLSRNIIYQHSLDEIKCSLEYNGLTIEKIETLGRLEGKDIFILIQGQKL